MCPRESSIAPAATVLGRCCYPIMQLRINSRLRLQSGAGSHSGLGPDWRWVGRSRTDNEMVSEYERIDRLPGPDLRWS